jgi:hypothetical protein
MCVAALLKMDSLFSELEIMPMLAACPELFRAERANFPWLHERRSGGIGMKDACELAR